MQRERAVAMLRTMANMQQAHNEQVHPQWHSQGYEYYRAIWVECAEMLDHFGWKWWKKQVADADQVKLELVDIWHFALSELLRADTLADDMAMTLEQAQPEADPDPAQLRAAIEALALSTLQTQSFELAPFVEAMRQVPMDYEELFGLYIGKNVLNRFRQDHGYKDGSYVKVWQGREDNEHLVELIGELGVEPDALPDSLYAALAARYPGA